MMTTNAPNCYRRLAAAIRPRDHLLVSDWADRHRILSGKQSGMPGRWQTRVNPLLKEIMDALGETSPVREIVIMKSNQVGVTEAMVNAIGYCMHHAPCPAMVLMPTLADRDAWKAQKLNPLLQDTLVIRDLLGGLRTRDAAHRLDLIDFPGGILFLSGGNSPNSYAQRSARMVMLDDFDRFPVEVGDEGDPAALARGRCKAFPYKYKLMLVSTPTVQGASAIEREYQKTDRRRYHVPCPHCAHMQALEWSHLQYDKTTGTPAAAWYVCDSCGGVIEESHKAPMLAAGAWIAERPEIKRRGYHINALTSPVGLGPSWLDLAREWHAMHRTADGAPRKAEPPQLKAFFNLHLGMPWEDRSTAIKPHHLLQRAEDTPVGSIPPGILALTVGIDTQDSWLEAQLIGWRPWQDDGRAGWQPIEIVQFHGDTARPGPWDELEAWLNLPRVNAYGKPMRIHAAAIDNRGHRGDAVKAFTQRTGLSMAVYRVQGSTRRQSEIIAATAREPDRDHRQRATRDSAGIWTVGTETAKDIIYGALSADGDVSPEERRIRFPSGLSNEYYTGLLSEVYNPETRRYEQRRGAEFKRNEPLDTLVYAIAIGHHRDVKIALRRTRIYRGDGISQMMTVPDPAYWRRAAKVLEADSPTAAAPPPEKKLPPPVTISPQKRPSPPARRRARDSKNWW